MTPIYVFECNSCLIEFDVLESREVLDSESFKPKCPKCEGESCRKLIRGTNFELKGKGWYKDGYAKEKQR